MVKALDKFYKDDRNKDIRVFDAISVIKMEELGYSDEEIKQVIEETRTDLKRKKIKYIDSE